MRLFARLLLLTYFYHVQLAMGQQPAQFGMKEVQDYAIRNNLEIQSLKYAVEAEKAKSQRAQTPFWPTLGIAGGGTFDTEATKTPVSPTFYGYATYNVFNGFQDRLNLNLSEKNVFVKQAQLDTLVFKTQLDVEKQFQLVITKKAALEVVQKALTLNQKNQDLVRRRSQMGAQSVVDVMEFSQKDASIRSELLGLEQDLEEAKIELGRMIGGDLGQKLVPTGTIEHRHLAVNPPELISQLAQTSKSLKARSTELQLAQIEKDKWRSQWMPRVDFELRVDAPLPANETTETQSISGSRALLTGLVKFDLFRGFDSFAERTELNARYYAAESTLRSEVVGAIANAERLFKKLQAIERRVDVESQNSERAEKYYNAVYAEYQRGFKNSADVAAAAENLLDAQLREVNFRYDFVSNRIELETLLGRSVETKIHDFKLDKR